MEDKKIVVLIKISPKNGKEKEIEAELLNFVDQLKGDESCIKYQFHREADKKGNFLFYEIWKDKKAVAKHLASDHIKNFWINYNEDLAEPVEITFWEIIE
ncbi:MAG: antibiotic biosynthesis monooxygenase [Desulfobacterales bacterium]|nr:antibiotic biosynthesis monooxygenase [Desulfobacterales bacterium]